MNNLAYTRAEIDLGALNRNVRRIRERLSASRAGAGPAELIAVVKADAYGHGAVEVSKKLVSMGVERLAVATVEEGIELREAGIDIPILVLISLFPGSEAAYVRHHLDAVVASDAALQSLFAARLDGMLRVHLEVETGMHRLGIQPPNVQEALSRLRNCSHVEVEGIMTHLAASRDGSASRQVQRFDQLLETLGHVPPLVHIANSGGLYYVPKSVGGRDAVRIGGALYGLPAEPRVAGEVGEMEWVMRLVSRVVRVDTVPKGESVSYGGTWTAPTDTRVATIACGYGDGYPRSLSNRGEVLVAGTVCPVVGLVCMDMLMVDVTTLESEGKSVDVGEPVIMFGAGTPDLGRVAEAAGTIAYSLTCGITARVPRIYTDEE